MIIKNLEDKSIVWFNDTNEYLVVEPIVAEILSLTEKNKTKEEINNAISKKINIPKSELNNLIEDVTLLTQTTVAKKNDEIIPIEKPIKFLKTIFYKINNIIFKVDFSSEYELSLVHPKFAHLQIESTDKINHYFKVYSDTNFISFIVDNVNIGVWKLNEAHYFQGKFSMKIVELMHQKSENNWLGVFHASAISNGKDAMLFLGDSGNGKSTSLALLQANNFTYLADDFVPVAAKNQEVYSFPSAISIKKNSLETLLPIYPELKTSAEYHFKRLNKIVRYLPPKNSDYTKHLPCKNLVFIKYKKNSSLQCNRISNINAFEQLVPDSWLSPLKENAEIFLNWFTNLNCYQLTYSDNNKMVAIVSKIFNNEL
ncbi:hypothetical protein WH52_07055 [Tenacibaculum holothuriorum]|uniref:Serine kinase n=1 Tax=Tenacibaculum holothuriorum TaxID=1635173 RepID=A0A1Y2PDE7_9FLAO|nr:hypothetical protein [Tenacibaculum holothuriorum]OSY88503.1 hypothetical protein WH52_07055 [Tenacibaculum holothuriorum]